MPRGSKSDIILKLKKEVEEKDNKINNNNERYIENDDKQRKIISKLEDEIAGYKNFLFSTFGIDNIPLDYFKQVVEEKRIGRYVTSYRGVNNKLKYIVMKNYGSNVQKAEFSDYKECFLFLLGF